MTATSKTLDPPEAPGSGSRRRAAEHALGRRHRVAGARVDLDGRAQRAGEALEAGFDDVVRVRPVQILDMQGQAGMLGKSLEPFLEQLGVHVAELGPRQRHLPDQIGPVRGVERAPRQRFVHRDQGVTIAPDAAPVAERLRDGLAEDDAGVLGGVVEIDVQVALGLQLHVDEAVARQLFQHVVEEADAGRDPRRAGAVEIDRRRDAGFLGGALYPGRTHGLASAQPPDRRARRAGPFSSIARQPPAYWAGATYPNVLNCLPRVRPWSW